MPGFVPKFQLWSSDGNTLLYTFPAVFATNLPQSVPDSIEITNLRSSSGIIIDGGDDKPFDAVMSFHLSAVDYTALTTKITALESTVQTKTAYLLRIERSSTGGDWYEYRVKRLLPFVYPESLRNNVQQVQATFRANAW